MDKFTAAYLETARWSDFNDEGEPFDSEIEFSPDAIKRAEKDCAAFQAECDELIGDCIADWGQAGHDFSLTRNGHGAGFWDGDWPLNGDLLTQVCKSYGPINLYIGDDGMLEFS